MQRTVDRLTITVSDSKYPLTLTDSAVEAVQEEAAGIAAQKLAEIESPAVSSGADIRARPGRSARRADRVPSAGRTGR